MFAILNYILSLFRILWLIWLWLWLCACIALWVMVVLFSKLPDYRPVLEQWVSNAVHQSITVGEVSTYWMGWQPTLALQQVRWIEPQSKQVLLELARVEVTLNVFASLYQGTPLTSSVLLNSHSLTLIQQADGSVTLAGLPNSSQASNPTALLLWLSLQPDLSVSVSQLTWVAPQQPPLVFSNVQLMVQKQAASHRIQGKIDLPQRSFNGVLAQRLAFDGVISGLPGQWQTFSCQVALEQLEWTSPQAIVALSRMEGQLSVKPQSNASWQIDVTQLVAVSPPTSSLLPSTNDNSRHRDQGKVAIHLPPVTLHLSSLTQGGMKVSGQLPKFSLDNLSQFIIPVQTDFQDILKTVQGTLQDIEWTVTSDTWQWRSRFLNIACQASEKWPGISQLSGHLDLTSKTGTLQFEAAKVTLQLPQWYQHPLALTQWRGQLQWQRLKNKWLLMTPNIQFFIDNQTKLEVIGKVEVPVAGGKPNSEVKILFHEVPLAKLPNYIPKPFLSSLSQIQLDGTLPKVQLLLQGRGEQLDIKVMGTVKNAHLNYIGEDNRQVELKDWSGQVKLSSETGVLQFDQAALTLNFPHAYSHPLSGTRLQGQVHWQLVKNKKNKYWHITLPQLQWVTQQMPVQVLGSLDIPQAKGVPVQTNLKVTLQNGQLAQVAQFLPDKLWPNVIHWFEEAQMTGKIQSAKASLTGPLNALFAEGKSDRFQFEAQVNQANFNYAKDWPPMRDVKAKVVIQGRTLTVTSQQGKLLNNQIRQVEVKISDLKAHDPLLSIVGTTHGPAIDGLRFLDQSPLHKKLDLGEKTLGIEGEMDLSLKIALWLSSKKDQVNGKISFKNNKLHKKSVGITFTDVTGTLAFDNGSVSAPKMRGKLFGKPVKFSILTLKNQRPKRTRLQLTGQADSTFFAKLAQLQQPALAELPWDQYLSGKTSWQAILDIPSAKTDNEMVLEVESNLAGLGIQLPAPLGKTSDQSVPVTVRVQMLTSPANVLPAEVWLLRVTYGERFHSLFKIEPQTGLKRGTVLFGTIAKTGISLPAQDWLNIQGQIPTLSLTEWQTVFESLSAISPSPSPRGKGEKATFSPSPSPRGRGEKATLSPSPSPSGRGEKATLSPSPSPSGRGEKITGFVPLPSPSERGVEGSLYNYPNVQMTLHFDSLEALGQVFTNLVLQANYTQKHWQMIMNGSNLEGQVTYQSPSPTEVAKLNLTFDQITLRLPHRSNSLSHDDTSKEDKVVRQEKKETLDPHRLPTVSFYCKQFRVGEINFGTINFSTQSTVAGIELLLESNVKNLNILAKGQWEARQQQHQTRLQGSLNSENLGQLLHQLGVAKPPLQGGLSQLIVNAQWPGTPAAFSLASVTGRLSLLVQDGQLVEIEPGVGRLFGLFDWQALPQRLALDFNDVFGNGLSFSNLVGFISVQGGIAQIDHLVLHSPVASLEIRGKTDLVAQRYDQTVTVIPHVFNALPVAGAVAGGVGGGVAATVVQQVLQTELEKTMSFGYRVFGSWEKPQMERFSQ